MPVFNRGTLFFIPFPVMSHFVATVKAAELLADRNDTFNITVLLINIPLETNVSSDIINTSRRINFLKLSPHTDTSSLENENPENPGYIWKFVENQKPVVRDTVSEILRSRESDSPAAFVIDMVFTPMIDVADELGIPSYVFFTSGAACLGLVFHFQSIHEEENEELLTYQNSTKPLIIPGYKHPVPSAVLPEFIFNKKMSSVFFEMIRWFRRTKGILCNTFLDFESYAIQELWANNELPTVYPIGPILQHGVDEADKSKKEYEEIINWLDEQPNSSVVFLCFGTRGGFSENQVKEIADGLELSGHRFLWALRRPPPEEQVGFPTEYENQSAVLPEGFLDRTKNRGKVIGWAPQMAVLAHPSVGGFVSHCGWNSTLESIWFGVPVATWPLTAEQQANAFQLVKEFGMAVEIQIDYRRNSGVIIPNDKICGAITELMDLENPIRSKVQDLKDKSRKTLLNQGPSDYFLGRFIEDLTELCWH